MKKTALIIFSTLFALSGFCQDQEEYRRLVREADQLYSSGDYLKSGQKYSAAFVAFGNKGMVNDRYNSACSWALAGETDSAFVQLFKISKNGNYTNLPHLQIDTDLNSLQSDNRWKEVIELVRANKEKSEADFDKPLVAILDTIFQEDQKYRHQISAIEEKHGWESDEMNAHWKIINWQDSINLIKIRKILDERGWLGADVIGRRGNSTLFLVIQHSELSVQEKYLPMMREAVKKGNANSSGLALLEDRVALRKGGLQIYGSQIGKDPETGLNYVKPLADPDNVDQRRKEVGLSPIQDYIARWQLTWDAEEYKAILPKYLEMEKSD